MEEDRENNVLEEDEVQEIPFFIKSIEDFDTVQVEWGTLSTGFELPEYTLSYGGSRFAPLGGIHSLTGKSGNGKTMTFSILMSAILSGEYMGLKWEQPDIEPRVLYVDTEMEERNTKMVIARVHAMCHYSFNEDHPRLRWMNLRDVESVTERWKKVVKAIETFRPTVAFLDGNLDLVADFNEIKECQPHIRRCMAIASYYKMSLWCLVHENPKSDKMVGHLGSMLERKATDVFCAKKVKKNKKDTHPIFEIENMKNRGEDTPMFSFQVERDATKLGIPRLIESDVDDEEKPEPMAFSTKEIVEVLFKRAERYQSRELYDAIKQLIGNKSTAKADEVIKDAIKQGFMAKQSGTTGLARHCVVYTSLLSENPSDDDDEKMFTSNDDEQPPF